MPSTRARTSAVRTASTRPGSSITLGTSLALTTMAVTSGAGGGPGGDLALHAASTPAIARAGAMRSRAQDLQDRPTPAPAWERLARSAILKLQAILTRSAPRSSRRRAGVRRTATPRPPWLTYLRSEALQSSGGGDPP